MRITSEQVALLESLKCERLSSNPNNMRLVDNFFNRRNSSLVYTLQTEAMEEDTEGSVAYYVIKDKDENILFFFSLKSGSLYDSHLDTNLIKLLKSLNTFVQNSLSDPDLSDKQKADLNSFQEKIRSHKGITQYDLDNLPKKKEDLFADLERELNRNVTHVGKTYSSIELVHFCANNEHDDLWLGYNMPHSIGVVVCWYFIVKKILDIKELLGIQYLFLFAADLSDDRTLVNFYNSILKFNRDEERATVKPIYDLSCEFMYQETKDLAERRQAFFDNFNHEDEEI